MEEKTNNIDNSNISLVELSKDGVHTQEELKESIKDKIENLCKVVGKLEYRVVELPKRDISTNENILEQKIIFKELENKIIFSKRPYDNTKFLNAILNNYNKVILEVCSDEIIAKMSPKIKQIKAQERENMSFTDLYFVSDMTFDFAVIQRNQQFINELYDKINRLPKTSHEEVIALITDIYNDIREDNAKVIELLHNGEIVKIDDKMIYNVYKYFNSYYIKYFIMNNLPIPYIDLEEYTSDNGSNKEKMLKSGGIRDTDITRIEYFTNPNKGLLSRIFTLEETWFIRAGNILSNKLLAKELTEIIW